MGILTRIKDKLATKFLGELITDLGTLDSDEYGRHLSLSIRQRPGHAPHLVLVWSDQGGKDLRSIRCTKEWADQFERIAMEFRRHLSVPGPNKPSGGNSP